MGAFGSQPCNVACIRTDVTVCDLQIVFLEKFVFVFLAETQSCVSGLGDYKRDLDRSTQTFYTRDCVWCVREIMGGGTYCACGCRDRVAETGHYRKDCRRRIATAGGVCPPNVRSAASKRYNFKQNPKNSEKRKLALRAANLQAVQDDPTLNQTLKMSTGTSASVSDRTHKTHLFTHRRNHCSHMTHLLFHLT